MQDINLVASLIRMLECHLDEFGGDDPLALKELTEQQQTNWLQCLFLFSLVWSVGGNTDDEGRKRFDASLRRLLAADVPPDLKQYATGTYVKVNVPIPDGKMVG